MRNITRKPIWFLTRQEWSQLPCILVGHSYGGAVITEAGTDSSVAGLVYIAAHMPDAGENEADDGKRFPTSHAVYISRPKEVAALIEEAAAHAR